MFEKIDRLKHVHPLRGAGEKHRALALRDRVALPVLPGYPLRPQKLLFGVRVLGKAPLDAKIRTEADEKHSLTPLRDTEVRRIQESKDDVVFAHRSTGGVMSLQTHAMVLPTLALLPLERRMGQLKLHVFEVVSETLAQ